MVWIYSGAVMLKILNNTLVMRVVAARLVVVVVGGFWKLEVSGDVKGVRKFEHEGGRAGF